MKRLFIPPRRIEKTGDQSPAGSLWRYVWRMSGWHQVVICLLALCVALLSIAPLELQKRIINNALGESNLDLLLWMGTIYAAVLIVQALTKFGLRIYQGWIGESSIRYNREHLAGILGQRGGDGDGSEGQAVSILGAEIDKLGGFVGECLAQPAVNLGTLVAIASYMIVVEPKIALFSAPFLLPQMVAVPWSQRLLNRLLERRVRMIRELSDQVARSSGERLDQRNEFGARLDRIYRNRMRSFLLKFAIKGLVNLLNNLAPLSVLMVGGYWVIQGETSVGVVVAFVSGFDRLANPLRELLAYYRVASQAQVQHEMIARWMSGSPPNP